jgi:translation initiation factor 3 subunit A
VAREEEEAARRTEEARRREVERLQREIAEEEAEEVRKLMAEKGITIKDGEVLNKRALQQKEFERKTKEQHEFEARMAKLARNMDHLERARREEEAPFLEMQMVARMESHKLYFEKEQTNLLATHRARWETDLPEKHATAKMAVDRCGFTSARAGLLGLLVMAGVRVEGALPSRRRPHAAQ